MQYIRRTDTGKPTEGRRGEGRRAASPSCCYFCSGPHLGLLFFISPFFPDERELAAHRKLTFSCLIHPLSSRDPGSPLDGKFGEGASKFISWSYYNLIPWAKPTLRNKDLNAGTQIRSSQLGLGSRASALDFR